MKSYIGKKVLVRSCAAGVYFGTLEQIEGETVKLTQVRNIWSWDGATCLSQIANDGIKSGRISPIVSSMIINGCCQIMPLAEKAIVNLEAFEPWEV